MATTLQALKTYYDNLMRSDFAHIPAAHQTLLGNLATQVDGGATTLAAAQQLILKLAVDTTSVASLAYSFFTVGTPTEGGFDYLVSAGGPNANNLNSAYYQSFNTDNRYINFAVNLGKGGEGAAWFATNYGGLTMAQATAKAYVEIFGVTPDAAKVTALLNDLVPDGRGGTFTRQQYFASYGGDGLEGQGTKAAMVGWLLAAAAKEDTGSYAKANDAFLADLAADGVAAFRSGLVAAYGAPPAAVAGVSLTIAADKSISPNATDASLKSTAGDDVLTGTAGLNAGSTVDAGAGRDTINLTGTIYGQVLTSDGNDTITLGAFGVTTATLGVPAVAGTVKLTGGNDVVTLKGGMAAGTSLTATGTGNVLHIDAGLGTTFDGTVSGFQTVYYHAASGPAVSGASVVYDMISDPTAGVFSYGFVNNETVVLKDTANDVYLYKPVAANGGTQGEVHLQNYKGGTITFSTTSQGPQDTHTTFTVHVDTDSTARMIVGWGTNSALGANYKYPLETLVIDGAGKLTAEIAATFATVDATQAGDLDLTYRVNSTTTDQAVRLGDGTNVLNLAFYQAAAPNVSLAVTKFYLGAGADTVNLIKNTADPYYGGVLANLHIANGTKLDAPTEIVGFQKGVDHLVLDSLIHAITANVQTYADGKTTLQDAVIAVSAHVAVNTAAIFTWNGDTYVYAQDSLSGVNMGDTATATSGDGLIKLTGVTGLTVGTGAGSYDIHYA